MNSFEDADGQKILSAPIIQPQARAFNSNPAGAGLRIEQCSEESDEPPQPPHDVALEPVAPAAQSLNTIPPLPTDGMSIHDFNYPLDHVQPADCHVDKLNTSGNYSVSWVNPKLEARTCPAGSGIFALQPIKKNETLIVWTGRIVTIEECMKIAQGPDFHYILQVAEGFYQAPLTKFREPADWSNHSCEPNAGFGKNSPILLCAMCDISPGSEICFDYAMSDIDDRIKGEMECLCGKPSCRKIVTTSDWKLYPELWVKYKGYFSPHVQRSIDALQAEMKEKAEREQALVPSKPASVDSPVQSVSVDMESGTPSPRTSPTRHSSTPKKSHKSRNRNRRNSTPNKATKFIEVPQNKFKTAPAPAPAPQEYFFMKYIDRILLNWFGLARVKNLQNLDSNLVSV